MNMMFHSLCQHLGVEPRGQDVSVTGLQFDSRLVKAGDLFIACPGADRDSVDGHDYISAAMAAGAVALMAERVPDDFTGPCAQVADSRKMLAKSAELLAKNPSSALKLVGITGTNGKTTVTQMLQAALQTCGVTTASLGTLGAHAPGIDLAWARTTPEAPELSATLRKLLDKHVQVVAMEVSSHALSLKRVDGLNFTVVAFSNLSQDHLDFHQDMQSYYQAKRRLFVDLAADEKQRAVICVDDDAGRELARELGPRAMRVSAKLQPSSHDDDDIYVVDADFSATETQAKISVDKKIMMLRLPLLGAFNLANAVLCLGIVKALGLDVGCAAQALAQCPQVPGRMEAISGAGGPAVIVDYAHSPQALQVALQACRTLSQGKLYLVFGAGGHRDKDKRVKMGQVAAQLADHVYITDDNPRDEDPESITRAIASAWRDAENPSCAGPVVIHDRAEAIAQAISRAAPQDLVLIAGKGHEDYQELNGERRHFDDREQGRAALQGRSQ